MLAEGVQLRQGLSAMGPRRNFLTLLTENLAESRDWYVELLGYRVDFDSDWFVHLQSPDNASVADALS